MLLTLKKNYFKMIKFMISLVCQARREMVRPHPNYLTEVTKEMIFSILSILISSNLKNCLIFIKYMH